MSEINKSEHYADVWNAAHPGPEKKAALELIVTGFLQDTHKLIGQFKAGSLEDVMKILEQQQSKWNALCRKAEGDGLTPALFDRILEGYDEPMYEAWKEHLKMKKKRRSNET